MDERLLQFLYTAERVLERFAQQLPSYPEPVDWSALAYRWQHHSQGGSLQAIPHPHTLSLDDEYLAIVQHWLGRLDIRHFDEKARGEALRWAQARGSRSGRAAWQFARDWAGRTLLGD